MTTKYKIAIYSLLALAGLGVLVLIWYLMGAATAAIVAVLGIGAGGTRELERYAAAQETERKEVERIDLDTKTELAALAMSEQQAREALQEGAKG